MKIRLLTSLMAICLLGPAYALDQNNAQILQNAETELRGLGCVAYQTTATASGTGAGSKLCFSNEIGPDPNDSWYRVYKAPQRKTENENAIWWVGDSRTVGMYSHRIIVGENEAVLAKTAMGHDWLVSTALPKLKSCMRDGDTVILALGANDLWRPGTYINTYQKLIQDYPNVKFYVLSVNPVLETLAQQSGYRIQNDDIQKFNSGISNAFSPIYINTYNDVFRVLTDRCTGDGVHYNNRCDIEQDVRDAVMNAIGR